MQAASKRLRRAIASQVALFVARTGCCRQLPLPTGQRAHSGLVEWRYSQENGNEHHAQM